MKLFRIFKSNFLLLDFACYLVLCCSMNGQPVETEMIQYVVNLMQKRYPDSLPGAALIVARNGRPIISSGFGLADLDRKIPINPEHSFAIGSVSKQFTAVVTLMLKEKGELSLEDKMTAYFPDASGFEEVSILNLLTHTSGIRDLFELEPWTRDLSENLSRNETLEIILGETLEFAPGERSSYSNSGYYLLGIICEKVSGLPLNRLIERMILDPMNMTETSFLDDLPPGNPSVLGYEKRNGQFREPDPVSPTRFFAGGSVVTTIDDLLKWDEALYSGSLISSGTRNLIFQPVKLNNGQLSPFAPGWEITSYKGLKLYGHGGGTNGFVSQVYRIPEAHLFVALLSNGVERNNNIPVSVMAHQIVQAILDHDHPEREQDSVTLTKNELQHLTGDYRLPDGTLRRIIVDQSRLYYESGPGNRMELYPETGTVFRAGRASKISFLMKQDGSVERFEIHTGTGRSVRGIRVDSVDGESK